MPEITKRYAMMIDAGFLKKKLYLALNRVHATADDIVAKCGDISHKPQLAGHELFRIYYYDAPPHEGKLRNPIDQSEVNFSTTPQAAREKTLLDKLALRDNFAIRKGVLSVNGWRIPKKTIKHIINNNRALLPKDLKPDIKQKGVDMRIGLDIASIAGKRIVDILVLVAGDADFIPAMKIARKEGLLVYLESLGHGVSRELKVHADIVL
ncbi:MAG: NYN domain-containing protein [Myxococcota bacterium]|nr:NYN domain-containing protein [Myxococcota bacterium]